MDFAQNLELFQRGETESPRLKGIRYQVTADTAPNFVDDAFFKLHARIDFDTDDALVASYVKAATQELEKWAQMSFTVKTIRFTAKEVYAGYRLMFGPVNTITTAGYTNTGDILNEEGCDVTIDFTTLGVTEESIKIAVCRYAAGLYLQRENIIDTKFSASGLKDEAKLMLNPYRRVTYF